MMLSFDAVLTFFKETPASPSLKMEGEKRNETNDQCMRYEFFVMFSDFLLLYLLSLSIYHIISHSSLSFSHLFLSWNTYHTQQVDHIPFLFPVMKHYKRYLKLISKGYATTWQHLKVSSFFLSSSSPSGHLFSSSDPGVSSSFWKSKNGEWVTQNVARIFSLLLTHLVSHTSRISSFFTPFSSLTYHENISFYFLDVLLQQNTCLYSHSHQWKKRRPVEGMKRDPLFSFMLCGVNGVRDGVILSDTHVEILKRNREEILLRFSQYLPAFPCLQTTVSLRLLSGGSETHSVYVRLMLWIKSGPACCLVPVCVCFLSTQFLGFLSHSFAACCEVGTHIIINCIISPLLLQTVISFPNN